MGISESQALQKLEGLLIKIPPSWEYRGKLYLIKGEKEKGEIAENAKRFIQRYTSDRSRYYIPHPSTIATYALYVACNMSGKPMRELDINKITGKKTSFKKIQEDSIHHRKVIGIDFNYNYHFVEDENLENIQCTDWSDETLPILPFK